MRFLHLKGNEMNEGEEEEKQDENEKQEKKKTRTWEKSMNTVS